MEVAMDEIEQDEIDQIKLKLARRNDVKKEIEDMLVRIEGLREELRRTTHSSIAREFNLSTSTISRIDRSGVAHKRKVHMTTLERAAKRFSEIAKDSPVRVYWSGTCYRAYQLTEKPRNINLSSVIGIYNGEISDDDILDDMQTDLQERGVKISQYK
jgi:uncharacterized protein YerC